jgi:hypothetical protein
MNAQMPAAVRAEYDSPALTYKDKESERERERAADLIRLLPAGGEWALDAGARDGYFSFLLADRFKEVTALDLEQPTILHERIRCKKGDITNLDFHNDSMDFVFCAEVIEHIPPRLLNKACSELSRVTKDYLLIGVPYKQDTRVGRTTCYTCGKKNPPWGHVNIFDQHRLKRLFPTFQIEKLSFVGISDHATNWFSTQLMDLAGNPYGTYDQNEPCIHCGHKLKSPPERNLLQKVFTRIAFYARSVQKPFVRTHPNWIHILFKKSAA